jgi:hypothetical protein
LVEWRVPRTELKAPRPWELGGAGQGEVEGGTYAKKRFMKKPGEDFSCRAQITNLPDLH